MPRRKKHRYHYGALVPHTGNKGFKIEYASNRLRVSLERVGNVWKYVEFGRFPKWDWPLTKMTTWYNPRREDIIAMIEEFKEKVERDAKKGQEYLNTKGM